MADIGAIRTQLAGIKDETTKRVLINVFEYVLGNLRIGVPEHQTRAENLQQYWLQSTTATSTGEFSIAHGLPSTPHYAIAVLELDKPGAWLPPLEVSRAADGHRLYLKSTSTGVPITLLIE